MQPPRAAASSFYEALFNWARRTTTSFADLISSGFDTPDAPTEVMAGDGLIYRLKLWPALPQPLRTARVFRALSVMSQRPVNRHWMQEHCGLRDSQFDSLVERLLEQDAIEVIDSGRFRNS